jgi:CheY-like chemotaxis protein
MKDSATQYAPATQHTGAPLKILVAEDNAADRFWLEMVLNSARIPYSIIPVTDGESAKNYLQQHVDVEWDVPDLVFLDQSLPCLNAMEIVQEVPKLRSLPYCIVTGSSTEKERWINEFGLSPHCYVVKPLTREKLVEFLNAFSSLRRIAEAIERSSPLS